MTRQTAYSYARLGAALGVLMFVFACSAILNTDELQGDGGAADAPGIDGYQDQLVLPDYGTCVNGAKCKVAGKKGLCEIGKLSCTEAGTGTCVQTVQPTKETCNNKDQDCDGVADSKDTNAHISCGSGKYCAGSSCKSGCWRKADCTGSTDTCTNHVCKCGTGSACKQPNPSCASGTCRCDSNSTCKSKETCKSGRCDCGSSQGPSSGPFCSTGTCNPTTGKCDGVPPPDAGPDLPLPDKGLPDKSVPDTAVPDAAVPDAAVPDAAVPDAAVPDAPVPDAPVPDAPQTDV